MEHRSRSIKRLKLILNIKGSKDIFRKFNRKMAGIGIIRSIALCSGGLDIGPALTVMLGKPVGSTFSRSRLKIVEISVFFLII